MFYISCSSILLVCDDQFIDLSYYDKPRFVTSAEDRQELVAESSYYSHRLVEVSDLGWILASNRSSMTLIDRCIYLI